VNERLNLAKALKEAYALATWAASCRGSRLDLVIHRQQVSRSCSLSAQETRRFS